MPIVNVKKISRLNYKTAKRGDTIIEVMFAIAVFSLVAVLTISMMDAGVSDAQGALELVVARNELNAQAEAIRFVHSSYLSELTLPECTADGSNEGNCQQYKNLWENITMNAITPPATDENAMLGDKETAGLLDLAKFINDSEFDERLPRGCDRVYRDNDPSSGGNVLQRNNAFILNTRNLNNGAFGGNVDSSYLSAETPSIFKPASLNARVLYTDAASLSGQESDALIENGTYDKVKTAEGIWVVAVMDSQYDDHTKAKYYDFYIESCWYSPGANNPTVLDTVIRLYNSGSN